MARACNPRPKRLRQDLVDEAVALDPALAREGVRHDINAEVSLAAFPPAAVPAGAGRISSMTARWVGSQCLSWSLCVIQSVKAYPGPLSLQPFFERVCGEKRSSLARGRRPLIIAASWISIRPSSTASASSRPATSRSEAARRGACEHPGCKARGRVPRAEGARTGRAVLAFCLDHVRDYNASYNYFAGMTDDAVAGLSEGRGHRPSAHLGHGRQSGRQGRRGRRAA